MPAGILYSFLQNPLMIAKKKYTEQELETRVNAELRMPGWVLADLDVVRAIDSSFDFIKPGLSQVRDEKNKVVKDADGNPVMDFDANSRKYGYIRKPEEFALMLSYVDFLLRDTGNAILSGDIRISPYRIRSQKDQNACAFCPYHDVCGFDPEIDGFAYRDIDKEDDAVLEEKMAVCTEKGRISDAIYAGSGKGHQDPA